MRENKENDQSVAVGVVAIGRNEGERLKRCLESLSGAAVIVYVDSGSGDGSVQWARQCGVDVIELDASVPFTAARARNVGLKRLCEIAPDIPFVQFVDGDCELDGSWFANAVLYLDSHSEAGAICGRLRERYPERSIYNWLCDREWDGPAGEVRAVGGIAMMRTKAIVSVGGYLDILIAGEEPELCVRLRSAGWRVWRLDVEMALHDAAMTHFYQWWRRSVRSGFAFAQGAYLHGAPPERHYTWEARRAWLWGVWLPLACLTGSLSLWPWGMLTWLIYPLQVLRQIVRNTGSPMDRSTMAFFQVLARFPEGLGQIKFLLARLLHHRARLIEYK